MTRRLGPFLANALASKVQKGDLRRLVLTVLVASLPAVLYAQGAVQPWPRANEVNVVATVAVRFDKETGFYLYTYAFTNLARARRQVAAIHIPLRGVSVTNIQTPAGWSFFNGQVGGMLQWCACEEEGFVAPPGYVENGRGLPSKYQIAPGQTLSGFSFHSASSPVRGIFYAEGWVPIPIEGIDLPEGKEPDVPDYPDNLFKGFLEAVPGQNALRQVLGRAGQQRLSR